MTTADQIRNKIVEGDLEESLDLAIHFLQGRDPGLYSECLQHKGRLNDHNRQYRLHIISVDTMDMTRAQVRSALLDVVIQRIETLSNQGTSHATPPTDSGHQQQHQTVTLNFGQATISSKGFFVPSDSPSNSIADHTAARQLIEDFVKLLATYEVENAAWRAAPFLHRSLLQGEMMQPQFKQNNFYNAHQRFRNYKVPINFVRLQSTNRTAIGSLRDRDEGEEYVYTLEKNVDNGGMPGSVRVFFPKNGEGPKITLVSL